MVEVKKNKLLKCLMSLSASDSRPSCEHTLLSDEHSETCHPLKYKASEPSYIHLEVVWRLRMIQTQHSNCAFDLLLKMHFPVENQKTFSFSFCHSSIPHLRIFFPPCSYHSIYKIKILADFIVITHCIYHRLDHFILSSSLLI